MTATKTIFEKAYIVEAQAIKAAIKEFGEAWADGHIITRGEDKKYRVEAVQIEAHEDVVPGFAHCPHCGVHLSNGVLRDGDCADQKPISMKEHVYECMACGEEFGPLLVEKQAEAIANASMAGSREAFRFSTIKSPVKRVWHIADEMPKASRKEVIAECVRQGVGYGTARTQYQAWFKASQESKREDIRQPYEKAHKSGE